MEAVTTCVRRCLRVCEAYEKVRFTKNKRCAARFIVACYTKKRNEQDLDLVCGSKDDDEDIVAIVAIARDDERVYKKMLDRIERIQEARQSEYAWDKLWSEAKVFPVWQKRLYVLGGKDDWHQQASMRVSQLKLLADVASVKAGGKRQAKGTGDSTEPRAKKPKKSDQDQMKATRSGLDKLKRSLEAVHKQISATEVPQDDPGDHDPVLPKNEEDEELLRREHAEHKKLVTELVPCGYQEWWLGWHSLKSLKTLLEHSKTQHDDDETKDSGNATEAAIDDPHDEQPDEQHENPADIDDAGAVQVADEPPVDMETSTDADTSGSTDDDDGDKKNESDKVSSPHEADDIEVDTTAAGDGEETVVEKMPATETVVDEFPEEIPATETIDVPDALPVVDTEGGDKGSPSQSRESPSVEPQIPTSSDGEPAGVDDVAIMHDDILHQVLGNRYG
jgi:hypothetical protein